MTKDEVGENIFDNESSDDAVSNAGDVKNTSASLKELAKEARKSMIERSPVLKQMAEQAQTAKEIQNKHDGVIPIENETVEKEKIKEEDVVNKTDNVENQEDTNTLEVPEDLTSEFDLVTDESELQLNKKQNAAFKAMRKELSELRKQASSNVDVEEVTYLKDEIKKLKKFNAELSIEADEDFKKNFTEPIYNTAKEIEALGTAFEIDPNVLSSAANMKVKDRILFLNKVAPSVAPNLAILYGTLDRQKMAKAEALKSAEKIKNEILKKQEERSLIDKKLKVDESLSEARDKLVANKYLWMMESKTNSDWNDKISFRLDESKKILLDNDPKTISEMVLKASMVDDYKTKCDLLEKELKKYKNRAIDINSTKPQVGITTSAPSSESQESKKSLKQLAEEGIAKLREQFPRRA